MRVPVGFARRAAAAAVCAAICISLSAPDAPAADRGAGLYEPFTGSASTETARAYVKRLEKGRLPQGRRLHASVGSLRSGLFVNEGRPVPASITPRPGAATLRAERSMNLDGPLAAGLGAATLLLGLGAAGVAARRPA